VVLPAPKKPVSIVAGIRAMNLFCLGSESD